MKDQSGGGKLNCVGFAVGILLLIGPLLAVVSYLAGLPAGSPLSTDGVEELMRSFILFCVILVAGSVVGYVGYLIVAYNFESLPSRPRWLFWMLLLMGILWIPHLGIGTIVGLALLTFTFNQRQKFGSADMGAAEVAAQG